MYLGRLEQAVGGGGQHLPATATLLSAFCCEPPGRKRGKYYHISVSPYHLVISACSNDKYDVNNSASKGANVS